MIAASKDTNMLKKSNVYATLPEECAFYGCPQVRKRDSTLTTGSQQAAGRCAGPRPMVRLCRRTTEENGHTCFSPAMMP